MQGTSTVTVTATTEAPHDKVLSRFTTAAGIQTIAAGLLGLEAGRLIDASGVTREPYSVEQRFALVPARTSASFLRPLGYHKYGTVPVHVTAQLPSTVSLRFQLGKHHVGLDVHVAPAGPNVCTVSFVLQRDFLCMPATDFLIRCAALLAAPVVPSAADKPVPVPETRRRDARVSVAACGHWRR